MVNKWHIFEAPAYQVNMVDREYIKRGGVISEPTKVYVRASYLGNNKWASNLVSSKQYRNSCHLGRIGPNNEKTSNGLFKTCSVSLEALNTIKNAADREGDNILFDLSNQQLLKIEERINRSKSAENLINWYWSRHHDIPHLAGLSDGLCQCSTEKFITRSRDPKTARSFLMIGALIDQIMFTHFHEIYDEFEGEFRYPKLYAHIGGARMASPSWMVYSYHGYDKKADWDSVSKILNTMLSDTEKWLQESGQSNKIILFYDSLNLSINTEFEDDTKERLTSLMQGQRS